MQNNFSGNVPESSSWHFQFTLTPQSVLAANKHMKLLLRKENELGSIACYPPHTHTHLSMVVLTIPGQPYPSCQLTADVGTSLCSVIWPHPAGSRATPVVPDCSINSTYQSMCTSTSTCFTQRVRSLGNRRTYTSVPSHFSDPIIPGCQWQTSTQSSFWLLKFMPYPPLVTSCIK